jgi:predicted metallopeptidase
MLSYVCGVISERLENTSKDHQIRIIIKSGLSVIRKHLGLLQKYKCKVILEITTLKIRFSP